MGILVTKDALLLSHKNVANGLIFICHNCGECKNNVGHHWSISTKNKEQIAIAIVNKNVLKCLVNY